MDTKIKESDIRVNKVQEETPDGDGVTESNAVSFSTDLMLVQ